MCCGNKSPSLPAAAQQQASKLQGAGHTGLTLVRYMGESPVSYTGEGTGLTYNFSAARALRYVDNRDVAELLVQQGFIADGVSVTS